MGGPPGATFAVLGEALTEKASCAVGRADDACGEYGTPLFDTGG